MQKESGRTSVIQKAQRNNWKDRRDVEGIWKDKRDNWKDRRDVEGTWKDKRDAEGIGKDQRDLEGIWKEKRGVEGTRTKNLAYFKWKAMCD